MAFNPFTESCPMDRVTLGYNDYRATVRIFLDTNSSSMFQVLSSQSDWENVWHHETHSRCRDKLVRHLYWACKKDIYHLKRRNQKRTEEFLQKRNKYFGLYDGIWLNPQEINVFLRTRRSNIPSITNECCTKVGCTWEEYAEYCPSNQRRNHF
uniref:Insulin-like domain-containing protein n=1 Tax=Glossina brevipalpis TaxID=37001 RepID=A0A1A9WVA4_9MUSC